MPSAYKGTAVPPAMRVLCCLCVLAVVLGDSVSVSEDVSTCALPVFVLLERATTSEVLYNVAFDITEHGTVQNWAYRVMLPAEADAAAGTHRHARLDPARVCVRARFRAHVRMPHFLDDYLPSFSAPLDIDRTVCTYDSRIYETTAVLNVPVVGSVAIESECTLHPGVMRCTTATALDVPVLMYIFASRLGDVFRQVWHRRNVLTAQQLCA